MRLPGSAVFQRSWAEIVVPDVVLFPNASRQDK